MKDNFISKKLEYKARMCRTPEELSNLIQEEEVELSDKNLDSIAGGWCSEHEWGCPADKCGVYGIGR